MNKYFLYIFVIFFKVSLASPIIQKPILFDQARIKLTQQYQCQHYQICTHSIKIQPTIIVIHWTQTKTLSQAFNLFNSPQLGNGRPELSGSLNVSAHYLVDRDGIIYQLMPDNWMARHVVGLNHYAIGIENVGGVDNKPDLTAAQAKSNAYLITLLRNKYPTIKYVIGHREYLNWKGTVLWLEHTPQSLPIKYDPGEGFMQRVRAYLVHGKHS